MLKYFWTYETDLPPDIGVVTFGVVHLTWVVVVLLMIFLTLQIYRRQTAVNRRRIQVAAAFLLVAGYIGRWIWAGLIGHYSIVEMLPLHLCTISVMVEFAVVITGRIIFKEFAYCCSLPGAISSLITPGMGLYPLLSYYYLQFAMAHMILILLPLIWVIVDGFRPDIRRFPACAALLLMFAGIAFTVNQIIGSNYMFLSFAPKDTPLEVFELWFGNPGYLIPTILLLFAIWFLFYLPWMIHSCVQSKIKLQK